MTISLDHKMDKKTFDVFSFFSGCGMLDLGFEKADFNIVQVNEYFEPFLEAYRYSRKKMSIKPPKFGYDNCDINGYLTEGSLKTALTENLKKEKNLVGFIGGPPCPDFSIAGKQKGRKGRNGILSLSYTNLITSFSPDFFLFENVKGLWKTAKHRRFYDALKRIFTTAGYCLTDRLCNSLEFGAPQDRDRIILIGIKKDILKEEYYNKKNVLSSFPWDQNIKYSLQDIKDMKWPQEDVFRKDSVRACPEGIVNELTVEYWFRQNDVDHHPDKDRFFKPKAGLSRMQTIPEGDSNKKSYKRIHRWRYSPTVAYGNNEVHLHPYKERRLSVAEAMALQSLPKEFALPQSMTLTNCFKTIGNGVPFLLANGVAKSLHEYLEMALK